MPEATNETIERIGELSMELIRTMLDCRRCDPGEHSVGQGVMGMVNMLAWAISTPDNYDMVRGALPLVGYLTLSDRTKMATEQLALNHHPEAPELFSLLWQFCPEGREEE